MDSDRPPVNRCLVWIGFVLLMAYPVWRLLVWPVWSLVTRGR